MYCGSNALCLIFTDQLMDKLSTIEFHWPLIFTFYFYSSGNQTQGLPNVKQVLLQAVLFTQITFSFSFKTHDIVLKQRPLKW